LLVPLGTYDQTPSRNRTVLLAAHRAGRIEVLNPITLQSLGSIKALPLASAVTSDDRGILFLSDGIGPEFKGCCALYAIDLNTRKMSKLLDPVAGVVVSPNRQHVLAQRGNVGIEAFSVPSLQREPVIPRSVALGVYRLSFSPDGRLLFGVTNYPAPPSLDILDFDRRKLVQRFAVSEDLTVLGIWVGDAYYLYGYRDGTGQLWRVKADLSTIVEPVKVDFPHQPSECKMQRQDQEMLGMGSRLFLYELFGAKVDRRDDCGKEIPGGFFSVDLQTGVLSARLAPDFHFASLISGEGEDLYGIDVKDARWTSVRLVRLKTTTGEVLARLNLASDVWFINLAKVPSELVPSGDVEVTPNPVNSQ